MGRLLLSGTTGRNSTGVAGPGFFVGPPFQFETSSIRVSRLTFTTQNCRRTSPCRARFPRLVLPSFAFWADCEMRYSESENTNGPIAVGPRTEDVWAALRLWRTSVP